MLVLATAMALVFFYAPNDADQGFVQKIFYVHVPLAIVALTRLRGRAAASASEHLRTRDDAWDHRSYVAIHMSVIFGVARAAHRRDLGEGAAGASGGSGTSRRWSAS